MKQRRYLLLLLLVPALVIAQALSNRGSGGGSGGVLDAGLRVYSSATYGGPMLDLYPQDTPGNNNGYIWRVHTPQTGRGGADWMLQWQDAPGWNGVDNFSGDSVMSYGYNINQPESDKPQWSINLESYFADLSEFHLAWTGPSNGTWTGKPSPRVITCGVTNATGIADCGFNVDTFWMDDSAGGNSQAILINIGRDGGGGINLNHGMGLNFGVNNLPLLRQTTSGGSSASLIYLDSSDVVRVATGGSAVWPANGFSAEGGGVVPQGLRTWAKTGAMFTTDGGSGGLQFDGTTNTFQFVNADNGNIAHNWSPTNTPIPNFAVLGAFSVGTNAPAYGEQHVLPVKNTIMMSVQPKTSMSDQDVALYLPLGNVTGSVTANYAGAAASGTVSNFLNNSASTSSADVAMILQATGTGGGDPYVRYGVSGVVNWSAGVDNSDSKKFKINVSDCPSCGTPALVLDQSGNATVSGTMTTGGNILPSSDDIYTIGSSSKRWNYFYTEGLKDDANILRISTPGNVGNEYRDHYPSPGASSIAHTFYTSATYATAGGKLVSFRNNNTEKLAVDKDGDLLAATNAFASFSGGYGTNGSGGASQGLQFSGSNTFVIAAGNAFKVGLGANNGDNFLEAKATGISMLGTSGPSITMGTGTPEAAVTAPQGSLFLRTNGGAGTTLYVKESGSGNTGWVAK